MKFINRPRGTGKTTALINTAHITGIPIITPTAFHKRHIIEEANRLNLKVNVCTIDERDKLRGFAHEVLIDDADMIIKDALKSYIGLDVVCATVDIERECETFSGALKTTADKNIRPPKPDDGEAIHLIVEKLNVFDGTIKG